MLSPYEPKTTSSVYHQYYREQGGHGLEVFGGDPMQIGYGIFGKLFKKPCLLLKQLGQVFLRLVLN